MGTTTPTKRKEYGTAATLDEAGEAEIFERIASGETMGAIAAAYNVTRSTIYRWIEAGGADRQAAFRAARRLSADVSVEEAKQILDEARGMTNAAQASIARARADYRRWLASCRNREAYGTDKQGASLVLNISELHLDALRQSGHMGAERAPVALPVDEVLDAEAGEE